MPKYDYLNDLPEEMSELLQNLEEWVIATIAKKAADDMIGIEETDLLRNAAYFFDSKEITDKVADTLGKTKEEADKLFERLVTDIEDDFAGTALDPAYRILETYRRTMQEGLNLTGSVGFAEVIGGKTTFSPVGQFYQRALNDAQAKVQLGLQSYDDAIKSVVDKMAVSGVRYYDSGITRRIDTAARTAILTGVNKAAGESNRMLADELGTDLMEITAHYGSRPDHAVWQGQVVSMSGREGYLSLADIGYGSVTGFQGANCRHNWYPYIEGTERAYTPEQLDDYINKTVTFEGKEYTPYEATQKQRQYEQNIRLLKEKIKGYEAGGVSAETITATKNRLRRVQTGYRQFSKATGQTIKINRLG